MSPYAQWKVTCPNCGKVGHLYVVSVILQSELELQMFSPLYEDGFEVPIDGNASTENEIVQCLHCQKLFPLEDLMI